MSRVKLKIKCDKCGNIFEHIHYCRNTTEAEGYEQWALKNITTCSVCLANDYKADRQKEIEKFEQKWNLSQLKGSEKQIRWARDIRYDRLHELADKNIYATIKLINGLSENDIDVKMLQKINMSLNEYVDMLRQKFKHRICMLTSNSAKEIIDNR